mgnify:FL=1|jgi:hypothetical protein
MFTEEFRKLLDEYISLNYVENAERIAEYVLDADVTKDAGKTFSKKESFTLDQVMEEVGESFHDIESLNSTYRRLNRQRSVFPSDTALLKALYLATFEATKRWTSTIRNWGQVYGELSIMYENRLPE